MITEKIRVSGVKDTPESYEVLRFTILSTPQWDYRPTTAFVLIECCTLAGDVVHQVAAYSVNQMHQRVQDSTMHMVVKAAKVIPNIPHPSSHIEIVLPNLSAFLLLSRQIEGGTNTGKWAVRATNDHLRKYKIPVKYKLGNPQHLHDLKQYSKNVYNPSGRLTATEEMLGIPLKKFTLEQKRIRTRLHG